MSQASVGESVAAMHVNSSPNPHDKASDKNRHKSGFMLLEPQKANIAQTESIGSSLYAERRNEFAKRLKKDSFASNIDSTKRKQMHAEPEEKVKGSNLPPNTYKGLKIGQYRVIGNGLFLLPK